MEPVDASSPVGHCHRRALAAGISLVPAVHASANAADGWTTYSGMAACKSDPLDNYCYGLQNGQAIGLIDAAVTVDELDQKS